MGSIKRNYSIDFLKKNHLAITHLRQKMSEKKLVLCLGAGFSSQLKIPNWKKLVENIAKDNRVNGRTVLENKELSLTTKIQVLYETFKKNYKETDQYKENHEGNNLFFLDDDIIRERWIDIVWNCLYSDYGKLKESEREGRHEYLKEYIEIIEKSPVTVNYNFDDVIERMFDDRREEDAPRKYESTSRPSMQFKRNNCVIYHPNGYIPYNKENSIEGNFVFSEKSFQDQLIDTISGRYNPLQYLFLSYTMLFTGLSLDDPTLRHMLRKNATLNPGHFHYYIYYIDKSRPTKIPSCEDMKAIKESYFETFNLVTLFLTGDEIKQLAQYINLNDDSFFKKNLQCNKPRSYVFYVSGTPGTGKTSSLNQLTDFIIQDEFQDRHRDDLYQSYGKLNEEQRIELDKWIVNQFRIRNMHISDISKKSCIQLIDRSSIDPICFVDRKNENALTIRAKELKENYCIAGLEKGKVIILEADARELFFRLNKRNPNNDDPQKYNYPMSYIRDTLDNFRNLFPNSNYKHIDTTLKSKSTVVKEIAHEVFFGEYIEADLISQLDNYVTQVIAVH